MVNNGIIKESLDNNRIIIGYPLLIKYGLLETSHLVIYDFSQLETSIFWWDVSASHAWLPKGNVAHMRLSVSH